MTDFKEQRVYINFFVNWGEILGKFLKVFKGTLGELTKGIPKFLRSFISSKPVWPLLKMPLARGRNWRV
jgi:hypothetical protein